MVENYEKMLCSFDILIHNAYYIQKWIFKERNV